MEFDVIYADGSRKRVKEGILYETEESRGIVFHNGTDRIEVWLAAAETLLVSLKEIGPGLEALAMGMAVSEEPRDALISFVGFASNLLEMAEGSEA